MMRGFETSAISRSTNAHTAARRDLMVVRSRGRLDGGGVRRAACGGVRPERGYAAGIQTGGAAAACGRSAGGPRAAAARRTPND